MTALKDPDPDPDSCGRGYNIQCIFFVKYDVSFFMFSSLASFYYFGIEFIPISMYEYF